MTRIPIRIRAIREYMKNVSVGENAVRSAIRMYKLGHRDVIDYMFYSIAVSRSLRLLIK